jgi:large repetitive protein
MVVDLNPSESGDQTNLNINPNAIVAQGQITIIKDAVPNDPQDFGFTITGPTGANITSPFTLDDDSDPTFSNQITFFGLVEGVYTITENVTSGWSLTGLTATENGVEDTTTADVYTIDLGARQIQITVANGEVWTTTFTNSVNLAPAMTVEKSSTTTSLSAPATVTYSYLVTNTGNVTLTGITLSDDNDNDDMNCPATTLAVGASMTCTSTHTFTQAELDANGSPTVDSGILYNQVTADSNETSPITDDLSIPITKTATMTVEKSSTTITLSAPGTVNYSYLVTNTGNVTLTGISLSDDNDNNDLSCPYATLAVGANMTCTATHTFTQAELDANGSPIAGSGKLHNIVTADSNETEPVTDYLDIPINQTGSIDLDKTGVFNDEDGDTYGDVGETITYTFTVTNTGNVTLDGVNVAELVSLGLALDCGTFDGILSPNELVTCTATYTLLQADLDAGSVYNKAEACGYTPLDVKKCDTDDETVPVPQYGMIDLDKTGVFNDEDGDTYGDVGETITYTFTVTNTGNVTLDGVNVAELVSLGLTLDCGTFDGILSPNELVTCTATYTLLQADLDAGSVYNKAEACGYTPLDVKKCDTDDETVPVPQYGMIDLDKTGVFNDEDGDTYGDVGETITYTFTVTNTGNVTLDGVNVAELVSLGLTLDCGTFDGILSPNELVTCTATYTLLQADLDAGSVYNKAEACGYTPLDVKKCDTDDETVPVPQYGMIDLDKTGVFNDEDGDTYGDVGETITYTFTVTNTGNVTLDGVNVAELVSLGLTLDCGTFDGILSPNELVTCTATYTLLQADLDAGSVYNKAEACGYTPLDVKKCDTDDETVPVPQYGMIDLDKTGVFNDEDGDTYGDVGETITYTFTVTNTGNVTLDGVNVAELVSLGLTLDCGTFDGILSPNELVTCTATYTLLQADLDAGSVYNKAEACGYTPLDVKKCDTDDETVPVPQYGMIDLDKTGVFNDEDGDTYGDVGETITYTFTVTNTGNVTLDGVNVAELVSLGLTLDCGTFDGILSPNELVTCTATYTLLQADLDAGSVYNKAEACGYTPLDVKKCDTDDETVPVPQYGMIDLDKTGVFNDEDGDTYGDVGETITYTFTVTNTGNVTLDGVNVAELVSLGLTLDCGTFDGILSPNELVTCTATYTLLQADLDAGSVYNKAEACGYTPLDVKKCDTDDETVPVPQYGMIDLDKTGVFNDEDGDTYGDVGETITYTFTVTNTGNVTLDGVNVAELVSLGLTLDCGTFDGILSPNELVTCTATYTLLQADLDAGSVYNKAEACGYTPLDVKKCDTDDETVPVPQYGMIDLDKTGVFNDEDGDTYGDVGETITYTFTVTNTGNVTLDGVNVAELVSLGLTLDCGTFDGILSPNELVTCTATYTLLQADLDAGSVYNKAEACGYTPLDVKKCDTDDETVPVPQYGMIDLDKTGVFNDEDGDTYGDVGETITYTFTVTNTGNVTLDGVNVAELVSLGLTLDCGTFDGILSPNELVTCTATYTLLQADLDAGSVYNKAEACGYTPLDVKKCDTDDETVPVPQYGMIDLDKTGVFNDEDGDTYGDVGETITYTFTVTNTGNVTLDGVNVAELVSLGLTLDCGTFDGILSPNELVTCTATYTLLQADLDAGSVYNKAEACGYTPLDVKKCDTDDETVPVPQYGMIDLDKTGVFNDEDGDTYGDVGETITYTFTVTNTGNVTLDGVNVAELVSLGLTLDCGTFDGILSPNELVTCTATYTLLQADLDAGSVYNKAEACGYTPLDVKKCDTDDETVPVPQNPALSIVKDTLGSNGTWGDDVFVVINENVSWRYKVTNTGNVTLTNVEVTDNKLASTAIDCGDGTNIILSMAPGDVVTCNAGPVANTVPIMTKYENTGTASTTFNGGDVTASDNSSYISRPFGLLMTNSTLCSLPNDQFNLLFTPDQGKGYKLNASNPGQFYYNMFYVGEGGSYVTLTLSYPWIVQGAMPIHVYDDVIFDYDQTTKITCLTAGAELGAYRNDMTLASYTDTNKDGVIGFGDTYTANVWIPETGDLNGFYYVNIHMDYGLKDTTYWSKGVNDNAVNTAVTPTRLIQPSSTVPIHFQADGEGTLTTITSNNIFKKNPGIGGLVYTEGGAPVPEGTEVTISVSTGKNPQTVTVKTDKDGWYMWSYKWTGKPAEFTVSIPNSLGITPLSQKVTLKANGYVEVNWNKP